MTTVPSPSPSIAVRELSPQPFLAIRRRIAATEIAATIGELLPAVFAHAQRHGFALAGPPITRYAATGPGLMTIEAGMPVTGTITGVTGRVTGDGPIEALELPGGPAAVGIHVGAYDGLPATHAAVERWLEASGYVAAGPPWEVYITDPGEYPDPADWRTEVVYPVRRA